MQRPPGLLRSAEAALAPTEFQAADPRRASGECYSKEPTHIPEKAQCAGWKVVLPLKTRANPLVPLLCTFLFDVADLNQMRSVMYRIQRLSPKPRRRDGPGAIRIDGDSDSHYYFTGILRRLVQRVLGCYACR